MLNVKSYTNPNVPKTNSSINDSSKYISPKDFKTKFFNGRAVSLLSINIRSLNGNFNKLESLLDNLEFKPDVISVSETWIGARRSFIYSLEGYNFVFSPCDGKSGGTGFFINQI